jgi:uncharacterized protein (TIGR03067 family)
MNTLSMRIPQILCILLTATLNTLAADPARTASKFDGTWLPVKAELAGDPMPNEVLKKTTLKLDGNRYEVTVTGYLPDSGTFTVDDGARPKTMKITGVNGPNAGKTFLCIYEIKKDTLRICYDLSGANFPVEFKTSPGTKLYLVTYNRKPTQNTSASEPR